jgi:hypothetical protein
MTLRSRWPSAALPMKGEDDYEGDDGLAFDEKPTDAEFLQMVREADSQALQYVSQVNRDSWDRGYRAFHQEHNDGSKYRANDYNNRSKLFIPKTRTAVRKDMAATAASLFGSVDPVRLHARQRRRSRSSAARPPSCRNW